MTDKELVEGCIKENKSSQEELYYKFAGKMLSVCQRYAKNSMEAQDILQDGFIKVFDNISRFRFQGSLEGWVRRTIVNTAINYYRKNISRAEWGDIEDVEIKVNASAIDQLSANEILQLIEDLPDGYRLVFNLYAIEGYSHKEISELLGINEGTSRSQLIKARRLLQKRMESMNVQAKKLRP